jgi:hypothetical protein
MEIGCGEQILFPVFNPLLLIQTLALGAVAVSAGVVGDPQLAAMITLIHMPAKLGSAAGLDGPHGPKMP